MGARRGRREGRRKKRLNLVDVFAFRWWFATTKSLVGAVDESPGQRTVYASQEARCRACVVSQPGWPRRQEPHEEAPCESEAELRAFVAADTERAKRDGRDARACPRVTLDPENAEAWAVMMALRAPDIGDVGVALLVEDALRAFTREERSVILRRATSTITSRRVQELLHPPPAESRKR